MALLVRSFLLLPGLGVIRVKGWEGPWGSGKQRSSLLWTLRVSIIDCVHFAFECTLECLLFVSLRLQYCGSLRTGIIYNYISHTDQWTVVRVVVDQWVVWQSEWVGSSDGDPPFLLICQPRVISGIQIIYTVMFLYMRYLTSNSFFKNITSDRHNIAYG